MKLLSWVLTGFFCLLGLGSALAQAPQPAPSPAPSPDAPAPSPEAPIEEPPPAAPSPVSDEAGGGVVDGGAQVGSEPSPSPGADAGVEGADPGTFDPFAPVGAAEAPQALPPPGEAAPEDALFRVDPLDVVGELETDARKAPGSVYVLDEKRLSVFKHDDAHQVLSQVPGVYVRQEDGYGLRPNIGMRGADSDRSKKITLMEDGVLFGPAPYSAPAAYYFPFMSRMVSVEAFKGASAIRFGPQTIGGALDLHTRDVPDKGRLGAVDGSFGNTFYTKLHAYAGYGFEHGGFLAEGASISSTGFKELDGEGDTGFSRQEFMLKGSVHSDPDAHVYHHLDAKLGYAREDSQETYLGLTDADFREKPVRRYKGSQLDGMDYWRVQGELFHTLGVGEHFELRTALYRHDFSRVWDRVDGLVDYRFGEPPGISEVLASPQAYQKEYDTLRGAIDSDTSGIGVLQASNDRRFVSEGVQSVGHYDFTTGPVAHQIELGVRLHHDQIQRNHGAQGYEMVLGRDSSGDFVPDSLHLESDRLDYAPLAKNKVVTIAVATHLVYEVSYKGLTLSPGVRAEIIRATYTEQNEGAKHEVGHEIHAKNHTFLFALGALYELTHTISLLAGVQQGMTPVAPDPGTKNDDPERANNYEAGVRFHDAYGGASVIGFLSDYDKVVAPCDGENCGSDSSATYASGKALVYGVEFGADYALSLPRTFQVPLRAAYTYTHAEFTEGFDTTYAIWGGADGRVEVDDQIPYIPSHQWSAGSGLSYREKMGVDIQLTFLDRMREEAGQGELEPGKYTDRYALLDAAAFYQVLDKLRVYIKGDNLTNSQPIVSRRPFGARPNRPWLLQAGFKWEL